MVLVTGAMTSVIFKLGKLLNEEYKLQIGVRKKIQILTRDLKSMQSVLRKVGDVPPNHLDDEVKLWAHHVRELSYNVEDILDTFFMLVDGCDDGPNPNKLKRASKKISKLFSKSKAHHQIAGMIKTINEQAEEVAERHRRYRADDIVAKPATTATVDPRLAAMFREVSQLIAIDKSRVELISLLSLSEEGNDGSLNEKMKIVSVVGAGGLGKTTLAKAVYDSIRPHFAYGAFVPVGQNPDLKKVLRDILIDLDKKEYINSGIENLDERQLLNELRGFLRNKRYFIVIDDIWEPQSWETIKLALMEKKCRSRIVITTRKLEVAEKVDQVYKLEPLSQDNSKKLFYTRLFGGEDKCPTNHVVELSDTILKKCGGVPLAIITMASLLSGKSRKEWCEVCNSPGFYQENNDGHVENIIHILSLSYYDLPSHLKTCLLYLSVYPEDTLIDKDSLIWKWVAEGFIKKKPGRVLFEVGEEYFHDLINRSLIQAVDTEDCGIIDGCRVHDTVLDLIVSMSHDKNFVSADGTLSQSHTRRLVQKNRDLNLTGDSSHVNMPQVRSLIVLDCRISTWALHPRLKLIRVLALEGCRFIEECRNFEQIGNLVHLRYLRIQDVWISKLPEKIGRLKFLQTLDLNLNLYQNLQLPCSIGNLTQLVCLRAIGISVPDGVLVGKLTALEELQIGGDRDSEQFQRLFVKDLSNLSELRVLKLHIRQWDMDHSMEIDLMQSLCNLKKMQHLIVDQPYFTRVNMNVWDAAVPSRVLRYLFLGRIWFPKLPSWISSKHLPNLSHLQIWARHMEEEGFKALGGLPDLYYLCLGSSSMATITSNNTEADGFFQKMRSLILPFSMVQFIANQVSIGSSTIASSEYYRGMASGKSRKKDKSRIVIMPNLEELRLLVYVKELMQNKDVRCGDLGLEYLPSIRRVKVEFYCSNAYEDDVEREEAAMRHAIQVHPNRPALQIRYTGKENMKRRSNDGAAVSATE